MTKAGPAAWAVADLVKGAESDAPTEVAPAPEHGPARPIIDVAELP